MLCCRFSPVGVGRSSSSEPPQGQLQGGHLVWPAPYLPVHVYLQQQRPLVLTCCGCLPLPHTPGRLSSYMLVWSCGWPIVFALTCFKVKYVKEISWSFVCVKCCQYNTELMKNNCFSKKIVKRKNCIKLYKTFLTYGFYVLINTGVVVSPSAQHGNPACASVWVPHPATQGPAAEVCTVPHRWDA